MDESNADEHFEPAEESPEMDYGEEEAYNEVVRNSQVYGDMPLIMKPDASKEVTSFYNTQRGTSDKPKLSIGVQRLGQNYTNGTYSRLTERIIQKEEEDDQPSLQSPAP